MTTYTLYQTEAKTFRVLVDGQVNPRLVGFQTGDAAIERCAEIYPGAKVEVPSELRHLVKGNYTLFRSFEGFYYLRDDLGVPFASTKGATPLESIKFFKPGEVNLEIPTEVAVLMSPENVWYFSQDYDAARRPTDEQFFQGGYVLGGMFRESQQDYETIQAHMRQIDGVSEFLAEVQAFIDAGGQPTKTVLDFTAEKYFEHVNGFLVWPLTVK